jgi:hypothetical protein
MPAGVGTVDLMIGFDVSPKFLRDNAMHVFKIGDRS